MLKRTVLTVFFFWSAQCIERHGRTSDKVKIRIFSSLNEQRWSFRNIFVYCKILGFSWSRISWSRKSNVHVETLVPIFIIINPGPYTCCKQSKTFHAIRNEGGKFREKIFLLTKSDWTNVRDLNHTVRRKCHVVFVFSKLLKDIQDYCLFNMSDQSISRGISF